MIAYRDFWPDVKGVTEPARIQEKFDEALADANDWAESESIDVINVESIGVQDMVFEFRLLRIWYRAAGEKPDPIPEI